MKIPINQFEQYINETILARGLSYFRKGIVNEPEEIAPGTYEAIVEGSDNYIVQITLEKGIITEHVCNCPYDYGPICKHVAAVLFYMQQDELDIKQKKSGAKKEMKPRKKRKTKADHLVELLDKVSHEELKKFIVEKTTLDRSFRDFFLNSFAHHHPGESKKQYSQQVKSILRSAKGRHGFIEWSATRKVGTQINQLLNAAEKHLENNNDQSAFYISIAVMEEMTAALQFSDDSDGDIGGCIGSACEKLYNIANKPLKDELRKQIFDYCIDAFQKNIYSGWDWHVDVLHLASTVLLSDKEFDTLMQVMENATYSEYEWEAAQEISYQILLKIKGENEAGEFLEENLDNSRLRRTAIAKAIDYKEYEKARNLALEGIKHDEENKPGQAKEWYDWLLKVAIKTMDKEKTIAYARYLFIDNFRQEQDYYRILKKHIPPEQWDSYVNEMVRDIKAKSRWQDTHFIAGIYIREEWWDKLLQIVKATPELNTISNYEKYLSKDYSEELVEMYAAAIISYLDQHTGRKHYQLVCRYLRRIIKLGDRNRANELIDKFRKDYRARRALLEELNRV